MKTKILTLVGFVLMAINSLAMASEKEVAGRYDYSDFKPEVQSLLYKHACTTCHAQDAEAYAVPFRDIAERYRGKTTYKHHGYEPKRWAIEMPLVEGLVKKVSFGGKGDWLSKKSMPQMDSEGTKTAEMTALVKGILALPSLPEEDVSEAGEAAVDELQRAKDEIEALKRALKNATAKPEVSSKTETKVWVGTSAQ